ncbi:GAF domain-containing protein [Candidatus Bipolaricaulota bacterium]
MGDERKHLETRLAVVSQIARVTSASLGLDELMQVVYEAVSPFFKHDVYTVMRYLRSSDSLHLTYGMESGNRIEEATISLDGFSGVVLRENRLLYVPDLDAASASLPKPILRGPESAFGSWLGVPLRVRNQTIGVLAIAAKSKDAYSEEDEQLLMTVADQLAVAIENARLFEATRRQAERLGLLNRVSRAVSKTLDLNELLEAVYQEITSAFDHDEFLVILHEEETHELSLFFGMMNGVRLIPERNPFGGLSGIVIGERRTLHVRNYEAEKEHLPIPYMENAESAMAASWLGVPLVVGTRVLGAMCIMIDRPYAYDDDTERLFGTLADQIAFAMSNAETFRSMSEAAERLSIVNRIGRAVGRETDLKQLAETVFLEIAPVFEADTFFIALVNEEDKLIEFPFMVDEGNRLDSETAPLGEGLTSTVVRTEKTLHIQCEEEYVKVSGKPAPFGSMRIPQTWLGIPLIVEGRVIGVINVQSYRPYAYTDDQVLLLATIADQVAMSFERARLFQAGQRELEERIQAEQQLESEHTLLRMIIDNIPDFIYAKDLEGRFVVANLAIARFFGFETAEEMLGKTIGDLLPPDEAGEFLAEEQEIFASGNPVLSKEENVVNLSLDNLKWLLITKLLLTDAHGEAIGLVGIDRDITARKHAEEEVKRYLAEVEVANEEVKQFAYIVSHDLRAPLVNLKGFSSELKDSMEILSPHLQHLLDAVDDATREKLVSALEEDIPEALNFIEASVSRMDGFINSVLKLSRVGRRELARQQVDAAQYVETCRQSLAHQIEERQAELIVGDLPKAFADPTALEQIIGNLLTNAVNYLDPERPGRIEIGGEKMALGTKFWIKDNGRGIAKEDNEKVFAPFRRAGKQDVKGEGMGLSYVRTMVRQHGGRIWFESEPDVGTTFYFTITDQQRKGQTDGKPE